MKNNNSELTPEPANIEEFIEKYYPSKSEYTKLRENIWNIRDVSLKFNIITTEKLIVFDSLIFSKFPDNREKFFSEVLKLNATSTKSAKLCLVNNTLHIRLVRELDDFNYVEFKNHVVEFKLVFPEVQTHLHRKFFSK